MPSDLSSYLATHYLTADTKPTKKRKRKDASGNNGGLLITEDDDSGWSQPQRGAEDDPDGEEGSVAVAGTTAEFRRSKKSNWKTIGAPVPKDLPPLADADAAAADAVLASAAAENEAARHADDELPVVEGGEDGGVVKMSDGTHAGLQTGASVAAQLRQRQRQERAELEQMRKERRAKGLPDNEGDETIYRDATGRRIDVSMKRAEARRAAAEAEEKERARKEALRGDVQIEDARRRREALEDAALMPVARGADDEELNRELREERRWNDPMAQFLTEKDGGGTAGTSGSKGAAGGKRVKGRPVYKGAAPPNRYGIRPGYRWDGVDRGNGFEAERFKAMNRREMNKGLDYEWQMDE